MTMTETASLHETSQVLAEIKALRPQLSANGLIADRDGTDPAANFELLATTSAARLQVPVAYGGLWEGGHFGGFTDILRAQTDIAAGDGSTGQNWGTTSLVAREIFEGHNGLPESTKQEIAQRLLHDGLRLVASNAPSIDGPVVARPTTGGVILSGTKTFNTNSGGRGIANVGCVLEGAPPGRHHVLVELNDPGVELHHDWDNMGQRGTYSQTVTYHDVFVADGWHYAGSMPSPVLFGAVMLLHASLMQGIGEGALEATVNYVRTLKRGTMPQFATAAEDPLVLRRLGEVSSRLAASRALLFATGEAVEAASEESDERELAETTVDGFRAKVACVEASLAAASEVFELTGARSTNNQHRLDRFWRNARTFASHDATDAKNIYVGMYEVAGELPPFSSFLRV